MQVLITFHFALIALLCPCLTSGAISCELELGTLELLRLSPLTPGEIFRGKLLSAMKAGLTPILAMLPAYAALCYLDPSYLPYLTRIVPILIASVLFSCVVGLACSSIAANVSRATTAAYVIVLSFLILPVFAQWISTDRLPVIQSAALGAPSSLGVALSIISADRVAHAAGEMWQVHLVFVAVICIVLLLITQFRLTRLLRCGTA